MLGETLAFLNLNKRPAAVATIMSSGRIINNGNSGIEGVESGVDVTIGVELGVGLGDGKGLELGVGDGDGSGANIAEIVVAP